jgi:hypothetical protein
MTILFEVSNLLGSPASGETAAARRKAPSSWWFPIYWVPQRVGSSFAYGAFVISIPFPIYWVPQRVGSRGRGDRNRPTATFPIYWVPQRVGSGSELNPPWGRRTVSNLLGSPASGESRSWGQKSSNCHVSNLLGSPASGENLLPKPLPMRFGRFQFIGFPSEWGVDQS